MVFSFPRSPLLRTWLVLSLLLSFQLLSAKALRVPAHVFPDEKSDIITYIEVDSSAAKPNFPKVLDAGLEGDWYWTSHMGDLVGYVSKREVLSKNQLKEGTLIRTNPTVHSWVLTKYQKGDRVRVRSRLSVGRVSLEKEIPVYFQIAQTTQPVTAPAKVVEVQAPVTPDPSEQTTVEIEAPLPVASNDVEPETEIVEPTTTAETTESIVESASNEPEKVVVAAIPEMAESTTLPSSAVDPLLEEKPRMPAQELANLAPPPSDLYQEFEGYLRVVPSNDAMSSDFQYQLNTRSGQRIVYVKVSNLRGGSYEDYLAKWINIRGSLDEIGPDFTLFIDAISIWVAPEE